MTITHSKPSLTIFADASIYADRSIAGWGGWARGDDREPVVFGGPAPFDRDSAIVELWALALMAQHLNQTGYLRDGDTSILLQSDSIGALAALRNKLPQAYPAKGSDVAISRMNKVKAQAVEPLRIIGGLLSRASVIYVKHVRGHQGGGAARSWVNEACDRRAKAEARAQFAAQVPS
jgi:ribonuclease HI